MNFYLIKIWHWSVKDHFYSHGKKPIINHVKFWPYKNGFVSAYLKLS